jgi:anti-anti-sigma factor
MCRLDLADATAVDAAGKEFFAQVHRHADTRGEVEMCEVGGRLSSGFPPRHAPNACREPLANDRQFMMAIFEQCTHRSALDVEGSLRAPVNAGLRQRIQTLLERGERRIVLDLSRLSRIDAAGVGELMRAYNTAKVAGAVLQVAHPSGRVGQLLDVAGVYGLLSAGSDVRPV